MTQTEAVSESNRDIAPYGEYKDSGVPWLGEIPMHWKVSRGKTSFRRLERPIPDNAGVVTCFRDGIVTLRSNRRITGFTEAIQEHGYQGVLAGDLVIHAMDAFAGAVGVSDSDGKCTPMYAVCEPITMASNRYFAHVVREMARRQWILALARGIRERSTDFRFDAFASQKLPLPPLDEQAAIVRYLAHVDRKIDRFVRAKRRLIALLEEQKQALIHQAVTKGLDPDVPMKDSGVEWLGEIPAHWDLVALRRYWDVIDCKHVTVPFHDEGFPLASVREAQRFDLDLTYAKRTSQEHYKLLIDGGRKPRAGDLIYCRNTSVGSAAYVSEHEDFAMGQDVCLIRSEAHNGRYLNYQLASNVMMEQLRRLLIGSTIPRINVASVRSLMTLVPPVQEQGAIVENLDRLTSEYREAIARQIREIDLIREYRTRLVSDVVTGKLDVREAAAALPEIDLHEAHFADAPEIDEVAEADQHDELDGADE